MAWSRMFNGMHYPSDILAGTLLGIWCGYVGVVVSKRIFPSK
jgi:membrane-associated phospholipid phosphatase